MSFRSDVSIIEGDEVKQEQNHVAGERIHHTMWTEENDADLGSDMILDLSRNDINKNTDILPIEVYVRIH